MHVTNLSRIKAGFDLGNISKVPHYKNSSLYSNGNMESVHGRAASMGSGAHLSRR